MFVTSTISPSPSSITECLTWRYATQDFDTVCKIDANIWNEIEESLRLTPSAFGLQPRKFVVVTDQTIKNQLQSMSWNQRQPVDCSHLIVICRLEKMTDDYVERFLEHKARERNMPIESLARLKQIIFDFINSRSEDRVNQWMEKQCYIALGNLINTASFYRIDNCPMEGIDPKAYDTLLGLPDKGCRTVVACALGYRSGNDKIAQMSKVRFPKSEMFITV